MIRMNQNATKASGGLREERKKDKKQKQRQRNTPNSTVQAGTQSIDKSKQKKTRGNSVIAPSICLPFNQEWPQLEKLHNTMILDELKSTFQNLFCDKKLLERKRKLVQTYPGKSETEIKSILHKLAEKNQRYAGRSIPEIVEDLYNPNKSTSFHPYIILGINAVTKHLERRLDMKLLLVCRSANPYLMTQHILPMCLIENISACAIHGMSENLSSVIGMNSCLAIGFKDVINTPFNDLIVFIKDKIPCVSSPWLDLWKRYRANPQERQNKDLEARTRDLDKRCLHENVDSESIEHLETCHSTLEVYGTDIVRADLDQTHETKMEHSADRKRKHTESVKVELLPLKIEWQEKKIKISKKNIKKKR